MRGTMPRVKPDNIKTTLRFWEKQWSVGAADLMLRVQQLLGWAHLSALLCTVKLHHTQQLTSLCHKTWQQLIRHKLWSDNPICEILPIFFFFPQLVDILGAKLGSCCFCTAMLRDHQLINVQSICCCTCIDEGPSRHNAYCCCCQIPTTFTS